MTSQFISHGLRRYRVALEEEATYLKAGSSPPQPLITRRERLEAALVAEGIRLDPKGRWIVRDGALKNLRTGEEYR